MELIEYLKEELKRLGQEASTLANKRLELDQELSEINFRLTHLSGAIGEINRMIMNLQEKEDAAKDDSEPGVSEGSGETTEEPVTDPDSVQA